MNLIFCFIIGFIGGFFFSTAISVSEKTQDGFKKQEEEKHGEVRGVWLPVPDKIGDCLYKCSQCGFVRDAYVLDIGNYCPSCGAKMEVSE